MVAQVTTLLLVYRSNHHYKFDTVAESTVNTGLRFLFAKCRGKQESPPTSILSNKERKKAQKSSFFEIFLSTGGRL